MEKEDFFMSYLRFGNHQNEVKFYYDSLEKCIVDFYGKDKKEQIIKLARKNCMDLMDKKSLYCIAVKAIHRDKTIGY